MNERNPLSPQTSIGADPAAASHLDDQRRRFEEQAGEYSDHHSNALAQEYRDRFIRRRVVPDDLSGTHVLDAMCGSGEETGALLARGAAVQGLDLSPRFAEAYHDRWGLPCQTASITDTGFRDESFDAVYICGGLHHIVPQLSAAIDEVHRILRPGGLFIFVEPNSSSWTDRLRRVWYRIDRRFTDEEQAISVEADIGPLNRGRFDTEVAIEAGGVAYLLVAQSFVLRTPQRFRDWVGPRLFRLEAALEGSHLDPRFFVCCRMRKRGPGREG